MNIIENIKNLILYKETDEHEFAPILSEIEDSPINPLGPLMFWIIIIFMFIACLWMYFGKVDVVITARGIVIPAGEEKLIQSLEKGVVMELKVQEGEHVEKGQLLAVITPAEYEPGLEINNLLEEENALTEQIASEREQYALTAETKKRLDNVKDIIVAQRYDEVVMQLNSLSHDINKLNAQLISVRNRRIQLEKQKQMLTSPIDGYVGQMFVHTIGGVVTPAEKIMTVVPDNAKLMVKASVLNQDVGFVKVGMPVSVKIDTFNFQKYGMLEGIVDVVSPNSRQDERLGPVFDVYINLKKTNLLVEHHDENVKIGMSTTNEIKIGKRRIIEFFIYPLVKYLDESIKVQ